MILSASEGDGFREGRRGIEAKKEALRKESMSKRKGKRPEDLSDKEAKTLLNEMLNIEDQRHQLQRELVSKLEGVISSKKILKLMRVEREFDRKLLDKLKEQRQRRKKN